MTEESSKFFPVDTVCIQCAYELNADYTSVCPECGTLLDDYAYDGKVIPLSDAMRETLRGHTYPRPERYLEPLLKLNSVSLIALILISGVCVWILSVIPLEFLGPHILNHPGGSIVYDADFLIRWALFSLLTGPLFIAVTLILLGEIRAKQLQRQVQKRTSDGRVERCRFTIQRSLKLETPKGSFLILKIQWNGHSRILYIPPHAVHKLGIAPDIENHTHGEADMFLLPFVFLALNSHGATVPTRVSSLQPRWLARHLKGIHMVSSEEAVMPKRKTQGSYFTSD